MNQKIKISIICTAIIALLATTVFAALLAWDDDFGNNEEQTGICFEYDGQYVDEFRDACLDGTYLLEWYPTGAFPNMDCNYTIIECTQYCNSTNGEAKCNN